MRTYAMPCAISLFALGLSCGDDETTTPTPPFDVDLGGGFEGQVLGGNRLVIRAADGRVLLDGLPPGKVVAEDPPRVGFATRTVVTTYEMQFGAFKPTFAPEAGWRVASTLAKHADGVTLESDTGELARLAFSADDGHLVIDLIPGPDGAYDPEDPSRATKLSWGFACDAEDHFAGFGAQTWDADHRGQTVPTFVTEGGIGKSEKDDFSGLWQAQGQRHSSHAPIPEYLSRRGYVLVAETNRRANFALCSESETTARIEVDLPAKIHVFDGPSPA